MPNCRDPNLRDKNKIDYKKNVLWKAIHISNSVLVRKVFALNVEKMWFVQLWCVPRELYLKIVFKSLLHLKHIDSLCFVFLKGKDLCYFHISELRWQWVNIWQQFYKSITFLIRRPQGLLKNILIIIFFQKMYNN